MWRSKRKVKFEERDGASVPGEFGPCSVRERKDVLPFENIGAEATGGYVPMAEDAKSFTEGEAEKA